MDVLGFEVFAYYSLESRAWDGVVVFDYGDWLFVGFFYDEISSDGDYGGW